MLPYKGCPRPENPKMHWTDFFLKFNSLQNHGSMNLQNHRLNDKFHRNSEIKWASNITPKKVGNTCCAGYLGHLVTKSEGWASTMALICHLAFTKRCTCQETQEQASSCSMNIHASTHQPNREVTYFLRLWKERQKHPLTLTRPFCSADWASSVPCKRTCQGLCCSLIVMV